jgi:predicted Zn-dependent peptidase
MDGTDAFMNRLAKNEIVHGRDVPTEEIGAQISAISLEDMKQWLKSLPPIKDYSALLLGPVKNKEADRLFRLLG